MSKTVEIAPWFIVGAVYESLKTPGDFGILSYMGSEEPGYRTGTIVTPKMGRALVKEQHDGTQWQLISRPLTVEEIERLTIGFTDEQLREVIGSLLEGPLSRIAALEARLSEVAGVTMEDIIPVVTSAMEDGLSELVSRVEHNGEQAGSAVNRVMELEARIAALEEAATSTPEPEPAPEPAPSKGSRSRASKAG